MKLMPQRLAALALLALLSLTLGGRSGDAAGISIFHDRPSFVSAAGLIGIPLVPDDYEAYALGPIAPSGAVRGDFAYEYDPSRVQPAVVPGGFGGQALGGSPFDVFVGDDLVTLAFQPANPLRAFGLDLLYAPSFDAVPADVYRLRVEDGGGAGDLGGNLAGMDPAGGLFFLGALADPGFEFRRVSGLSVTPRDQSGEPTFLVPAYQGDNLVYGPAVPQAVPEPGTFGLGVLSASVVVFALRRKKQCRPGANP
jgi:hypothetical protein